MEKAAIALTGRLVISQTGSKPWGMIKVPQSILDGVFKSLNIIGIEKPEDNAHISVFTSDEIKKIGGPDKIDERGRDFHYTMRSVRRVEPEGWDEMQYVYFITCNSAELSKLRESYGLSPLVHGSHPFHITVAVMPKTEKKSAVEEEDEEDMRAAKRRRMRNVILGITATAGGAYLLSKVIPRLKTPDAAPEATPPPDVQPSVTPSDLDTTAPDVKAQEPVVPEAVPTTFAEYNDYLKDNSPNVAHQSIDNIYAAYKTGLPAPLETALPALAALPDTPVKSDLLELHSFITESVANPTPEQAFYRKMEQTGIPAFDLSEGSRPAQKALAHITETYAPELVDGGVQRSPEMAAQLDPIYLQGLLKAMPESERAVAGPFIDRVVESRSAPSSFGLPRDAFIAPESDSTMRNLLPGAAPDWVSPAVDASIYSMFGKGYVPRAPLAAPLAGYASLLPFRGVANRLSDTMHETVSPVIDKHLPNNQVAQAATNIAAGWTPYLAGGAAEKLMGKMLPAVKGKLPLGRGSQATANVFKLIAKGNPATASRLAAKKFAPVYLTSQAMDLADTAGGLYGGIAGGDGGDAFFEGEGDRLTAMGNESGYKRYASGLLNPADNISALLTSMPSTEKHKSMASQGHQDAMDASQDVGMSKARQMLLKGDIDVPRYMQHVDRMAVNRFDQNPGVTKGTTGLLWNTKNRVDEGAKATWIKDQIKGLREATQSRR